MISITPDIKSMPAEHRIDLLSTDQIEKIKNGTLHLLENVGVHVPSIQALSILDDHGAWVDWDTHIVQIPPDLVMKAISTAPSSFVLGGREERFDLSLDGQNSYLCTDGCGVHVIDPITRKIRSSTKDDVAQMARVCDSLPLISFFWPPVSAQDYGKTAPLHECHAGLKNTLKHVRGGTTVYPQLAPYVVELAQTVRESSADFRSRPPICANICTIAPLSHDAHGLETALVYAEAGIPMSFMSMPTMGSTAPATPLGALVQGDAEVISAIVLVQLAKPGTPVMHSVISSLMEPHTGGYIGDLPLPLNWMATQIGHSWGIPSLGGGGVASNAAGTGWLSGSEGGLGAAQIPLAGGDITGFLGLLDNSMILSPEKIILDYEIIENVYDLFYGFEFNEEDFALEVIANVGPGDHFLRQKHTRKHLRDFRFSPLLRQLDETNQQRDPVEVAFEKYAVLAETSNPEPLADNVLKEMGVILEMAEQEAEKII